MLRKKLVEAWPPINIFSRTTSGLHRSTFCGECVGDLGNTCCEDLGHPVTDISGECRARAVGTDRCSHSTRPGNRRKDELAINRLIGCVGPNTASTCGVSDRCIGHKVARGSDNEPLTIQMTVMEYGRDHLATGGSDPFDIDMLTDSSTNETDDRTSIKKALGLAPSNVATSDDEHGDVAQVKEHRVRKSAAMGPHAVILRVFIEQFSIKTIILVRY